MSEGSYVMTPRFGQVKINEMFASEQDARIAGYVETAHYWDDPEYGILGKSLDMYHMIFAGFCKKK